MNNFVKKIWKEVPKTRSEFAALTGVSLVIFGCFQLAYWLGFIVLGLFLGVVALALDEG